MSQHTPNQYQDGSRWRRWNPHIHAPGTLLNDQFEGDWDGFLKAIEDAKPCVEVLGVTDYLCIETYKAVMNERDGGRLKNVKLLFPNVEFRLNTGTKRQKGINFHLLFCPDDNDHIEQIERALSSLTFEYKGSPHRCVLADIANLGRAHDSTARDDHAAYAAGANQFKVDLDKFRRLFRDNKWVQENCLVAVSASNNDGTAGLQDDHGFAAVRQEIESFAHVIFSSNQNSREFWIGKKDGHDARGIVAKYGSLKPCLHGCDAHSVASTCCPDDKRYCWLKGDPTFETLRQALLEPEERVYIGEQAPDRHDSSQCVTSVSTSSTPWLQNGAIPLNAGLVSIIGARGSGKTALADIIAVGADVSSPRETGASFIHRATEPNDLIGNAQVTLQWGDGERAVRWLGYANEDQYESVRYLSQQFVEQLCSASGLAVELRREIERVVFDASNEDRRLAADNFDELGDLYLSPIRERRRIAQEAIEGISDQINGEQALHDKIVPLTKAIADRDVRIKKTGDEMKTLVPKNKEQRAKRLAELEGAFTQLSTKMEKINRAKRRVEDLQKAVETYRSTQFPGVLARLKQEHLEAGLSGQEWAAFEIVFKGDVDTTIQKRLATLTKQVKDLTEGDGKPVDKQTVPLAEWPLNLLRSERDEVKMEVGMDRQRQLRYNQLQRLLQTEQKAQQNAREELKLAQGADARRATLVQDRRTKYIEVFETFLDEKAELERLYEPLQDSLKEATGCLKRLRLSVSREIDLDAWIESGEALLDLRRDSSLRGHGGLEREARKKLVGAWRNGTAADVGDAMQDFIKDTKDELLKSKPGSIMDEEYKRWVQQVATWLYSTDHIQMQYSITYDGVAIEQLSPGTRGIVLLLLYLVIDKQDTRPLIIDQPEENLDPKSVFDELVPHFKEARKRRQVIIVTHNANLVVNTDADQVIVASSEPNPVGGLPTITYKCGSIENPSIRHRVCDILEGGEEAFRDRERRYRLPREQAEPNEASAASPGNWSRRTDGSRSAPEG